MLIGVSTTRVRRDVWTTTNDISISFDEFTAITYTKHTRLPTSALNGQ